MTTPQDMNVIDRVLNDILIDFPIIDVERSWQDEAYNLMARNVNKKVDMLKEKYVGEVDDWLANQSKYHEAPVRVEE